MDAGKRYDIIIIGGGVIGCAIAHRLSRSRLEVLLLEKEYDVAEGTSKANSGVVHAGFNVKTGSLKARFNLEGLDLVPDLCKELGVPYRLTKKLVVAKDESELPYLRRLLEQGQRNGCRRLSIIGGDAIRAIEPDVAGEYALFSECTAVIHPAQFTIALAEVAKANGVEFRFGAEVVAIARGVGGYTVTAADGCFWQAGIVINAAGLYADRIHSLVEEHDRVIHPCRGEYFVLDRVDQDFLHTAVYPVPPADGRGLGIHLTPTTEGNIIIGPSAEYIQERDDTATTREVMDQLASEAFALMPKLRNVAFIRAYSGIRPKLFVAGGSSTFEDFVIEESQKNPGFISLIGIESPGLTSAPAIAAYIEREFIAPKIHIESKTQVIASRIAPPRIAEMDTLQGERACRENPAYGEIVCRCNHISRAEIQAALDNPLGARSLSAIKKRSHAMMGRCQSGFCLPKIIGIMTGEYGIDPESIRTGAPGSEVLTGHED